MSKLTLRQRLRLLPIALLADITRHPRYLVDFEFSSSWVVTVYNAFRWVFGAREGIAISQSSDSEGNVFCYTLENYLATWEGVLRAYFARKLAFKLVFIPALQLAGLKTRYGIAPYRFAIAFDASVSNSSGTTPFNHTVTGSNPYLLIGCYTPNATSFSVTYNSVTAPFIKAQLSTDTNFASQIYGLGAPATGTNSVSVTGSGLYNGASSYTGAQSGSTPDASNSVNANSTSITCSVTSVADNCWVAGWFDSGDRALSASTNCTTRSTSDTFEYMVDFNAAVHPAGSTSITMTVSGGTSRMVALLVTIAPFVAAATIAVGTTRMLMGVGS